MITKEELIRKFTQAIIEGNAAIFGGAGLSRPSGFVDWKTLLLPLAEEIGLDIDKETDLLSVAQYYRNERKTRTAINQEILKAFSKNVALNENIKILTRLPIFTYWTTNYDSLIEKGLVEAGRNPDVKSEKEQLALLKPARDAVVYKMHGDVSNPFNAVITKEDFETYELQRPLFRSALKGDLLSKVFLFIGFSFEDPNLNFVLSQMRSLLKENVSEHFAFIRKVQLTDRNCNNDEELYRYNKNKQNMQVNELCRYGIQTVYVDEHDEITEVLHKIENQLKLRNIFISGSADAFEGTWDRTSAEKLAAGLAASLVRENYCITSGFGIGIGSAVINGALDVVYKDKFGHVDKYLRLKPFPQNILDPIERSDRWKRYRESILEETGISIFIFGNKSVNGSIVEANGCIQEFEIAKEKGNLIIPIGSTGYAAKTIFDKVKADIHSYPYLLPYLEQLENETDVDKIISLVFNIIKDLSCVRC